jgi:hypothetical protein
VHFKVFALREGHGIVHYCTVLPYSLMPEYNVYSLVWKRLKLHKRAPASQEKEDKPRCPSLRFISLLLLQAEETLAPADAAFLSMITSQFTQIGLANGFGVRSASTRATVFREWPVSRAIAL